MRNLSLPKSVIRDRPLWRQLFKLEFPEEQSYKMIYEPHGGEGNVVWTQSEEEWKV